MMSSMIRSSIERSARAPVPFVDGLRRQSAQGILRHAQPTPSIDKQLGVLLDHRVLGVGQDHHHLVFGERIERGQTRADVR